MCFLRAARGEAQLQLFVLGGPPSCRGTSLQHKSCHPPASPHFFLATFIGSRSFPLKEHTTHTLTEEFNTENVWFWHLLPHLVSAKVWPPERVCELKTRCGERELHFSRLLSSLVTFVSSPGANCFRRKGRKHACSFNFRPNSNSTPWRQRSKARARHSPCANTLGGHDGI